MRGDRRSLRPRGNRKSRRKEEERVIEKAQRTADERRTEQVRQLVMRENPDKYEFLTRVIGVIEAGKASTEVSRYWVDKLDDIGFITAKKATELRDHVAELEHPRK